MNLHMSSTESCAHWSIPYLLLEPLKSLREMENTYLCDSGCGKLATAFGLRNTEKVLCCIDHLPSLLDKQFIILGLDEYSFISSPDDVSISRARKAQANKGLGNLTALEAASEAELNAAFEVVEAQKGKVLRSVEARFEEMKATLRTKSNEVKRQLQELKDEMKQFSSSKEKQLSPMAQTLCGNVSIVPRFLRFGLSDASDRVSAVLTASWALTSADLNAILICLDETQRNSVIESALREAADYAQRGIQTALQDVDLLVGDEKSFEQKKNEVLSKVFEVEREEKEKNLKWLNCCWDWRQHCVIFDESTIEVGQQLAGILSQQYGKFSEAGAILLQCIEAAQADPFLHGSQHLDATLCGVHFDCAQYEEAEVVGLRMLSSRDKTDEDYWTARFYIAYSTRLQAERPHDILERRQLGEANKFVEMMRLLTSGIEAYLNKEEAKKLLLQALRIGIAHFPCSAFTAHSASLLAMVSEGDAQEQYYRQAKSIYEATSPMSIHAANNLYNLGMLLYNHQQWSEAVVCYLQAKSIYSVTASMSIQAAKNCYNLGVLLDKMGQWSEAEDCHRQAMCIYECTAPSSIDAATNLNDLGVLLQESGKWNEAIEYFAQAKSVYEEAAPMTILQAKNLYNLGVLFYKTKQWDDAEKCYQQAKSVFSATDPQSIDAANNLNDLGILYKDIDRWNEANECWRQAKFIYEVVAPRSVHAADNLHNIGLLFHSKQLFREALRYFREAQLIYTDAAPSSLHAANNLNHIGVMSEKNLQWAEAEECYRQAQSIYEKEAPRSVQAANNLYNMALFLKARKKIAESMECFEKAEQIYSENCDVTMQIEVQKSIAELRRIG